METDERRLIGPDAERRGRIVRTAVRDKPDLVEDVEIPDDRQDRDEQEGRFEEVNGHPPVHTPLALPVESRRLEILLRHLSLRGVERQAYQCHRLPHDQKPDGQIGPVSYTHLRAHETDSYLVCRLLLEKKKKTNLKQ